MKNDGLLVCEWAAFRGHRCCESRQHIIQGRVGGVVSLTTKTHSHGWRESLGHTSNFQEHRHGPKDAEGQVSGRGCGVRQNYSWKWKSALKTELGLGWWLLFVAQSPKQMKARGRQRRGRRSTRPSDPLPLPEQSHGQDPQDRQCQGFWPFLTNIWLHGFFPEGLGSRSGLSHVLREDMTGSSLSKPKLRASSTWLVTMILLILKTCLYTDS